MLFSKNNKLNSIKLSIFYIASVIVIFRWFVSYYYYPDEPLLIKNLLDLEDLYYFPYILNLAEFNFNPNYTFYNYENNILALPIYSIIFHSLFYIIFNQISFIILELISLFIFFYLLFRIFKELKISDRISIILSLLIFLIPQIILFININQITSINLQIFNNIYNFRIPRPIITSLYFFSALLVLILILKSNSEKKNKFYYISISILLALCFGSFYYHFVFLFFTLFLIFLYKFFFIKENFLYLFKNFIFICVLCFTISVPFLILSIFGEPEALERIGLLKIDYSQKKIIINHLLSKFFSYKYLILFFFNSFLFYLIIYLKNEYCKKTSIVFYLLYISSILAPIIFFILSPSVSEIYHFINMSVIIGFVTFFVFSIIILLAGLNFFKNKIPSYNINIALSISILLLIILVNVIYFINFKNKNFNNIVREDFKNLEAFYKKNSDLNGLLTFDIRTQVWWLFKNKKLSSIDSALNSQKNDINEFSFIDSVKFLNISKNVFSEIISNKKVNWRYNNEYLRYFSWYKYQANSLTTHGNKEDYDIDLFNYIKKSSPTKSMQIIIPHNEHARLLNLFVTRNYSYNGNIDIIILKKNTLISTNAKIDNNAFCKLNEFMYFDVYIKQEVASCLK